MNRTTKQNSALHKYYELLADELNSAGLEMMQVLRHDAEIPWTPYSIKEFLWRPVQKAQLGKKSTTQLTSKEIDKVYETLTRHLSEKFDISIEFPSIEQTEGQNENKVQ